MLGLIETTTFLQLLDYGITVAMLIVFMRMYRKKDKAHEDLHKLTKKQLTDLVAEVTKALTDKNHSDEEMADAIEELTKVVDRLDEDMK